MAITSRAGKTGTIVVSALRARANFGKLLRRIDDERGSLVIEKRDEENRVTDRTTIGVLHAFNKRHGEDFNDEDVRFLQQLDTPISEGDVVSVLPALAGGS